MRLRLFLLVMILSVLLVMPAAGAIDGAIHNPISIEIPDEFSHLLSDEPIFVVNFTELYASIPAEGKTILKNIGKALVIILVFVCLTYRISSRFTRLYIRKKLSEEPESRPMQILAYLKDHPGAQQSEIVRATGYSRGSVSYNLYGLLRENKIQKVKACYYPAGEKTGSRFAIVLKNPSRRKIVMLVLENPGISQKQLAEKTAIPSATLRWHIRRLTEDGILSAERVQNAVYYTVTPEFDEQYAAEKQGMW